MSGAIEISSRRSPLWARLGPDAAGVASRLTHDVASIQFASESVRAGLLAAAGHLDAGGLETLRAADLDTLIGLYDEHFFAGWLDDLLRESTPAPLELRLSRRMTSAGGSTRRRKHAERTVAGGHDHYSYEIAVSTVLLMQSFADVDRPVVVSGLVCADRLAALQRIVEHELVHLIEFLVWEQSSCSRARFRTIASNVFGHTAANHRLVTQSERALVNHGVRVGDWVEFDGDGTVHAGFIRRITKRATVLVEDRAGVPYSDGRRYAKWFVPLGELRRISARR